MSATLSTSSPYDAAIYTKARHLPIHAVEFQEDQNRAVYFAWKRALDLVLDMFLLVVLFPLMLLIAVLIKLDSAGPVFFVQERVGVKRRNERGRVRWMLYTFPFYKFRSMCVNADPLLHEAYIKEFRAGSVNGDLKTSRFKLTNDSRITRLGRLLRKTSLDELPQLVNVLKGDISLVGPRPALVYEALLYGDKHYERFRAPAGITGLWQATARSQVPFETMVQMDIEYARTASLWLDLKLLLFTIPAVLSCRGAE